MSEPTTIHDQFRSDHKTEQCSQVIADLKAQLAESQRERDEALEHQEMPFHTCAGKDCKNKTCQLNQQLTAAQAEVEKRDVIIAEHTKLSKERQEWALKNNETIRKLNAELAAERRVDPREHFRACPNCEPVMCCNGQECGCQGMPVDFSVTDKCGDDCFGKVWKDRDQHKADAASMSRLVSFLISAVKCGEKWSDICEQMVNDAFTHHNALNAGQPKENE